MDVMRYFESEGTPLSVALHPSGLQVLIGFTDTLRLASILIDDIRPIKDFNIKGCIECQFSNGGQYFAVANGNAIQIFTTYT